jgi:hypothetical protein
MFLVAMRDGKPAQRINVTSTNLQLNASDLERARAIVAEIRGDSSQLMTESASAGNGLDAPRLGTAQGIVVESEESTTNRGEEKASIMLGATEGGNSDGDR